MRDGGHERGGAAFRTRQARRGTAVEWFLAALVILALPLRLHLVFVYEVNWDEFLHLSHVYAYQRGDLTRALQTIYVHAFPWVTLVPGNEVDQVVAARLPLFVLSVGTAGFLYLICRRLLTVRAALFAVLAYLSFAFVIRQGNSFRTDPIATFLLMAALWLIVCRPAWLGLALLAGGLIGLAGAVTIKSVIYVPTIALVLLIALWTAQDRRKAFRHGLVIAVTAALACLAFLLAHRLSLGAAGDSLGRVGSAIGKTLVERDFLNAILTFKLALRQNPVFWLAAALGLVACLLGLFRSADRPRANWATLLALGATLASLGVYTQSFAYYYPFMLAPAAALCGAALSLFPARIRPGVATVGGALLGAFMLLHYAVALEQDNRAQRRVLVAVHQIFPRPTAYIDRCSMVSSYPKYGPFMSVWGMQGYYRRGVPIMRGILEAHQPRFLIANRELLDLDALGPGDYGPAHFGLFEEDAELLKANFLRHWGPIYVAGKQLAVSAQAPSRPFEILIEGPYTVESAVPVELDGRAVRPGEVVTLAPGAHRLRLIEAPAEVTLRWGDHLYRPEAPPPEGPLFHGF